MTKKRLLLISLLAAMLSFQGLDVYAAPVVINLTGVVGGTGAWGRSDRTHGVDWYD